MNALILIGLIALTFWVGERKGTGAAMAVGLIATVVIGYVLTGSAFGLIP